MQAFDTPMTVEEFGEAVELAVISSQAGFIGAPALLLEALDAIVGADPQNLSQCVTRAYEAYRRYCLEGGVVSNGYS